MNDRELLELAARAAGIEVRWRDDDIYLGSFERRVFPEPKSPCSKWLYWRPLMDDGDALRLAVKLRFEVQCYPGMASVIYDDGSPDGAYLQQNPEKGQSDEQATRRRRDRKVYGRRGMSEEKEPIAWLVDSRAGILSFGLPASSMDIPRSVAGSPHSTLARQ
ncbi:hypothetical protein [Pseudomonas aeruginosa]